VIAGATDYYYVATEGGDYNVVATDANGCEVEAAIFDITASVAPVGDAMDAVPVTFPVPASDKLEIRSSLFLDAGVTIELFSADGKQVYKTITEAGNPGKTVVLDVTGFATGMYWMKTSAGSISYTGKFLIK
jgi:hypothetical protein